MVEGLLLLWVYTDIWKVKYTESEIENEKSGVEDIAEEDRKNKLK